MFSFLGAGKRPADEDGTNSNEPRAKRAKVATPSPADDLICPITLELPWDPVHADDGQHYEREAIEKHIKNHRGRSLRSPVTNEGMGKKLTPAPKIKSLIETLITTRAITGELADTWTAKLDEKKKAEELLKKAEAGDAEAMRTLASRYRRGDKGFKKDSKQATEWSKKAHRAGDVTGTAMLGGCFARNFDKTNKNKVNGIMYLGIAAAKGSNYAAQKLGIALAEGRFGLAVDKEEAKHWLEQCLVLKGNLSDEAKEQARKKLGELEREPDTDDSL